MAEIKEFAGYRYNTEKCRDINAVMAAPYNVMPEDEQKMFYEKSQYNIVRVSDGKTEEGDSPENNRYTRAAEYLNQWIAQGILQKEEKPVMYLYEQRSIYKNTVFVNHGIVALLKLEELSDDSSIKVCEETKPDFMENRYNLLSNTGANIDMINCMYIDSERALNHMMNEISEKMPDMEFRSAESITGEITINHLWVIDDAEKIAFIKDSLKNIRIFITDGRNRYQAALRYMKECRENDSAFTGDEPYNYIMAFLNNAYGDNLVQLPIQRILKNNKKFSEDYFIACAQDHFKVEKIIVDTSNDDLVETMKHQIETGRKKNIIGVYCGGNYFYRLTLTDEDYVKKLMPEHSEEYRTLDITVLNSLLLGELLNINKDNYDEYIDYTKRTTEGVKMINDGEAACLFVLNTVKAEHICEVVESGETMPEKSMYIFPKPVTGTVINKL